MNCGTSAARQSGNASLMFAVRSANEPGARDLANQELSTHEQHDQQLVREAGDACVAHLHVVVRRNSHGLDPFFGR